MKLKPTTWADDFSRSFWLVLEIELIIIVFTPFDSNAHCQNLRRALYYLCRAERNNSVGLVNRHPVRSLIRIFLCTIKHTNDVFTFVYTQL